MSTTGIPRHLTAARVRAAKLEALKAAAVAYGRAVAAGWAKPQARLDARDALLRAAREYTETQPESDGEPAP